MKASSASSTSSTTSTSIIYSSNNYISPIHRHSHHNNKPMNVIIIGGSSGMGKATAVATVTRGGDVLIVSRNEEKLKLASQDIVTQALLQHHYNNQEIKQMQNNDTIKNIQQSNLQDIKIGNVYTAILDVTNEESVSQFVNQHLVKGKWDGLVFSAAGKAPHGPIQTLPTEQTRELFETKFWGAYLCAKYMSPYLNDGGAIVFVSGVLNRRPGMNCSPLASTNGALEGLTRALALELGPSLRVNCLSPGFCNTERFDHMDEEKKEAMLKNTADSLPLLRVGQPSDMGDSIYFLLTASFCTGVVLDCDGGHHIRQYANKSTDPFRKEK